MSTEELLRPRYKVIADYPKSVYVVGTIINAGTTSEDCIYCDREGPRMRHYPHLFKKLHWSEEREPGQMPEYIKSINGWIHKVKEHKEGGCSTEDNWWIPYSNSTPAAAAEYEQYINQKEKQ